MNRNFLRFTVVWASIVCSAGLWLTSSPAAILVIDDFTQGPLASIQGTNTAQYGTTVLQTGLAPSHTLGGTRSVFVGSLVLATANIDPNKGRFNFFANNSNGYFGLGWGTVSPMNADLSGLNAFQLDFVDVIPAPPTTLFDLRVMSANAWFQYSIGADLAAALNGRTYGTLNVPFTRFAGVDFTHVQAIELEAARVPQGYRLSIDTFTAVPEPAAGCLGLLAVVMFGLRRR